MSGFSIPRVAVPAVLRLAQGGERHGKVFLAERVPQHTGHETPLEMLNRHEAFFPFRPDDNGTVLLVTKALTVTLAVPREVAGDDPARASAAKLVALDVAFADGSNLSGWAHVELPEHHSRLLDYLNAAPEPFFAVMSTEQETHFVNRAHVLYARPRE